MQGRADMLGDVIKNARLKADVTMEVLAEQVGVTERYLYRIENEGKIPSYDVLNKLIRELSIDPYLVHFPERQAVDNEIGELLRMLCSWVLSIVMRKLVCRLWLNEVSRQ